MPSLAKGIFLDRDGVLNRNVYYPDFGEWESPRHPADLVMHEGVVEALAVLGGMGFLLFIVTNQPSFAKGKTSMEDLLAVKAQMEQFFVHRAIPITASYYCFHHPKGVVASHTMVCECRKPSPFFLYQAAKDYGLDLTHSWMMGDRDTDIACGKAAAVKTIRMKSDHPAAAPRIEAEYMAATLAEAVTIIRTA